MHQFFKFMTSGVAAVVLLAASPEASAQNRGRAPLGPVKVFKHLSLTPEQITQINSILSGQLPSLEQDKAAVKAAKDALFEYLKKGGSDAGQVDTLAKAIGEAVAQLEVQEANTFIAAYGVLTPAQKTALANMERNVRPVAPPPGPGPIVGIPEAPGPQPITPIKESPSLILAVPALEDTPVALEPQPTVEVAPQAQDPLPAVIDQGQVVGQPMLLEGLGGKMSKNRKRNRGF